MKGCCYWFTGMPCSGKTTIAVEYGKYLESINVDYQILDGDVFRKEITNHLGFTPEDRLINIQIVAKVVTLLIEHGVVVLCAFVTPLKIIRRAARDIIGKDRFMEVYVKADQRTCINRDVKGMWAEAIAGKRKNFTGLDDPYEIPIKPFIVLDTDKKTIHDSVLELKEITKNKIKPWIRDYQI